MKKRQIVAISLILIVVLLPLVSWLAWYVKDPKPFNILIVDKTVLRTEVQEHISLNWILKHEKYVKPQNKFYDPVTDYYGFFPDDLGGYTIDDFNHFTENQLDSLADAQDMVYYTDLYGIYVAEWYDAYPHVAPPNWNFLPPTERSRHLYGRLTDKELHVLKRIKEQKKLIITEFNIMALPTYQRERRDFEETFSIKWSTWVGRYFSVLDTNKKNELPMWLKRNYIEQYGEWPFTKPGIAFVRSDDKVVILENETDLRYEVPLMKIEKPEYIKEYGILSEMKYPFWFEIDSIYEPNVAISSYHVYTNLRGDSILRVNNIPSVFPAVIKGEGNYPFYYFAGDFCDNPIGMNGVQLEKIEWLSSFTYTSHAQERRSFFWVYYQPLTTTIINNFYDKKRRGRGR